jgi:hypothetical protein
LIGEHASFTNTTTTNSTSSNLTSNLLSDTIYPDKASRSLLGPIIITIVSTLIVTGILVAICGGICGGIFVWRTKKNEKQNIGRKNSNNLDRNLEYDYEDVDPNKEYDSSLDRDIDNYETITETYEINEGKENGIGSITSKHNIKRDYTQILP